jgi:tetratricopeptide (TPR) repeat protein/tRNA A-37 threonylcarbamoyl transferase component Bud32
MPANDAWPNEPSPEDSTRVVELLARFEEAWDKYPPPPVIDHFLPPDGSSRRCVMIHLVHVDLERRLKASEPARVEDYLHRFPDLQANPAVVLDLVMAEYRQRLRREPFPAVEDYVGRFPQLRDELLARFGAEHRAAALASTDLDPPLPSTGTQKPEGAVDTPSSTPPLEVPGYEILGKLGRGAMGVVYKARHLQLNRLVALKMIRDPHLAGPEEVVRFLRETRAVARLSHPHIVQIYEVGEKDGLPYCALELVAGGNLAKKLAGTPQPPREAAELVETLARAMAVAHQQGIIHRDLKPGNVLLTPEGVPKVTDFGLAKLLEGEPGQHQSVSGAIMGTPPYMAPEQARGLTRQILAPTDVYALGAILYEMLTGRPPFQGQTRNETLLLVCTQEPVPPRQLQPEMPRDLENICLKCLQKEPRRRYADGVQLAADLRAFLNDEPVKARPVGIVERTVKWVKRRPTTAALIAVSVLGVLSVGGVAALYWTEQFRRAKDELDKSRMLWARQQIRDDLVRAKQEVKSFTKDDLKSAANLADAALKRFQENIDLQQHHDDPETRNLVADARRISKEAGAKVAAADKFELFLEKHDEALALSALPANDGGTNNRKEVQKKAWAALGYYGITPANLSTPTAVKAPDLRPADQDRLKDGCYLLLSILAGAEDRQGDGGKRALKLLKSAADIGGETRALRLRRARYLKESGKLQEGLREEEQAGRGQLRDARDYYLVGQDHFEQGRIAEAIAFFEKSVINKPDFFWSHYYLAICYLDQERDIDARAELEICRHHAIQNQARDWVLLILAYANAQREDYAAAERIFAEVESPKLSEDAQYLLLTTRGMMRLGHLQLSPSLAGSITALLGSPASAGPGLATSVLLGARAIQLRDGMNDLEDARRLRPTKYQALFMLALGHQMQAQWGRALTLFQEAIDIEPKEAHLYRRRAMLYRQLKDWPKALADLDRAIDLDWADQIQLGDDWANKGRLLQLFGQHHTATEAFQKARQHNPGSPKPDLWLAEGLLARKEYLEAGRAYESYFAKEPQPRVEAHRGSGLARMRVGDYVGAVDQFTRALQLGRGHAVTLVLRGQAYLALNRPEPALGDFRDAIAADSQNSDAFLGRAAARLKVAQLPKAIALRTVAHDLETAAQDAETALRLVQEAMADAKKVKGPVRKSVSAEIDAARILAMIADLATKVNPSKVAAGARNSADYCKLATTALQDAVKGVPARKRERFWRDHVHSETTLIVLWREPKFQDLERKYARHRASRSTRVK